MINSKKKITASHDLAVCDQKKKDVKIIRVDVIIGIVLMRSQERGCKNNTSGRSSWNNISNEKGVGDLAKVKAKQR